MAKFKPGNKGRPKGAKGKYASMREMLIQAFDKNEKWARIMVDKMFKSKSDFKWLCQFLASLEYNQNLLPGSGQTHNYFIKLTTPKERLPEKRVETLTI